MLVLLNEVFVDHVIGIEFAFSVRFLIRELAFLQMVEESLIGHDMRWVKWAFDGLHSLITI
jgi:hypothetical protein